MKHYLDWKTWLSALMQHPVPIATVFGTGVMLGFLYSYVPLHGAKNWDIEHLEMRVDAQNQKLAALQSELDRVQASTEGHADPEQMEATKAELGRAEARVARLEGEIEKAERSADEMRKSRNQWKTKYEAVQAERDALANRMEPLHAPASPRPPADPVDDAPPMPQPASPTALEAF